MESLRTNGYALAPDYLPKEKVDAIYAKADAMFRNLHIDFGRAYSVQTGQRGSLEHLPTSNWPPRRK